MITPRFSCSQNVLSVIVEVYCPAVRASEIELHIDDSLLSLHVAPYFLRLNFPANLVQDDHSSAVYDPASGYLTLTLTKLNHGENFPDLDLLGKLLAPPAQSTASRPTIEVLASREEGLDDTSVPDTTERNEILQAAANDWVVPQTIPDTFPMLETSLYKPYGFLNAYTGYFRHVASTENEINELGADAENLSPSERRIRRLAHEDEKWDPEYYMADFADTEQIDELLAWTHPHLESAPDDAPVTFTEVENAAMLRLPRKEYLATPRETRDTYLTLLTLLFAYAYDARTTQHDPTPESAWTIAALTPAFSALDPPPYHHHSPPSSTSTSTSTSVNDDEAPEHWPTAETLIPSYRRALAFPLHRSWALAESCRTDAARFLVCGARTVLRCLLELRAILDAHPVYYVYSRVWVDDFCRWIQTCAREDTLVRLGWAVSRLSMSKDSLGWDLVALERTVQMAEGQPDSDDEDLESERPAPL